MPVVVGTCPHCRAQEMSFAIFGVKAASVKRARVRGACTAALAAECQSCGLPIVMRVESTAAKDSYPDFPKRVERAIDTPLEDLELTITDWWPQPRETPSPPHLPEQVEASFQEAVAVSKLPGCHNSAVMAFRRTLEITLTHLEVPPKGNLKHRVDSLVEKAGLPHALADWAHEIRLVGNGGAHDAVGVTPADADAAHAFLDAFLRYAVSLPTMVAQRRLERDLGDILG